MNRTDSMTLNVAPAHRARVHAECAADAAGNAFEKFHAAQTFRFASIAIFSILPPRRNAIVHRQPQCG